MGLEGCYVLNVCATPNSCGEVLTPKVAELEGGAFRRWAERLFCSKPIKIVQFPSTGTVLEVGTIQSGQRQAKGSPPGSRCVQGNTCCSWVTPEEVPSVILGTILGLHRMAQSAGSPPCVPLLIIRHPELPHLWDSYGKIFPHCLGQFWTVLLLVGHPIQFMLLPFHLWIRTIQSRQITCLAPKCC